MSVAMETKMAEEKPRESKRLSHRAAASVLSLCVATGLVAGCSGSGSTASGDIVTIDCNDHSIDKTVDLKVDHQAVLDYSLGKIGTFELVLRRSANNGTQWLGYSEHTYTDRQTSVPLDGNHLTYNTRIIDGPEFSLTPPTPVEPKPTGSTASSSADSQPNTNPLWHLDATPASDTVTLSGTC